MAKTYSKKAPKAKVAEKVTDEELQLIKALVGQINKTQMQVGNLEYQKNALCNQITDIQNKLQSNNLKLKEKYGDVSINIEDGSINVLPKDEKLNS